MKSKKTQVVGCRLPMELYDQFEIKCLEKEVFMSDVIREAIFKFMELKESEHFIKQYDFKGWVITIDKPFNSGYRAFAAPKKYAELLCFDNIYEFTEIGESLGIEFGTDIDGDYISKDKEFTYVSYDPDDDAFSFLADVDSKNFISVLSYIIDEIKKA